MHDRPRSAKPPSAGADPLDSPGLHRGPIEFLPHNFTLTLEDRVRAMAGAPAWMRRSRRIERHRAALEASLEEAWRKGTPATWEACARAWDLAAFNQEIRDYNAYFPIERGLAMDLSLRDYTLAGERWLPLEEIDAAWILSRFPPAGAGGPPSPP
jgi:hypothetical protein